MQQQQQERLYLSGSDELSRRRAFCPSPRPSVLLYPVPSSPSESLCDYDTIITAQGTRRRSRRRLNRIINYFYCLLPAKGRLFARANYYYVSTLCVCMCLLHR